jgi:hypothetical protein
MMVVFAAVQNLERILILLHPPPSSGIMSRRESANLAFTAVTGFCGDGSQG